MLELSEVLQCLFVGFGLSGEVWGGDVWVEVVVIGVGIVFGDSVDFGVFSVVVIQDLVIVVIIEDSGFYIIWVMCILIKLVMLICEIFQLVSVVICQCMDDQGMCDFNDVVKGVIGFIV